MAPSSLQPALLSLAGLALASCRPAPSQPTGKAVRAERSPTLGEKIVQVVTGAESTCVRTESGRVACIGDAMAYRESALPRDTGGFDTHLPQVIDVPPSKDISAGAGFGCSIDRDGGKVRCWGRNDSGRLGQESPGLSDFSALPVPGLEGIESIDSLADTTCVRQGRDATCWPGPDEEPNVRFKLARTDVDPQLEARLDPLDDEASLKLFYGERGLARIPSYFTDDEFVLSDAHRPWAPIFGNERKDWCSRSGETLHCTGHKGFPALPEVQAGLHHACAPVDEGVHCNGDNTVGQAPPENVVLGARPKSLAVGAEHSCVVTETSSLLCWGASGRGQIGLVPAHARPARIVARDVERAWALLDRTCYATSSGTLACAGKLDDACPTPEFSAVPGLTGVTEVFPGVEKVLCAQEGGGEVWCRSRDVWSRTISIKGFGGTSARRSSFVPTWFGHNTSAGRGEGLCWVEDGRPQCAQWLVDYSEIDADVIGTTEPPPPPDPDRTLGPRETPFGTRKDFVGLRDIDEGLLCGLTSDGKLLCANRDAFPISAHDPSAWIQVKHDLPSRPVAQLGTNGVVMADGVAFRLSFSEGGDKVSAQRLNAKSPSVQATAVSDWCVLDRDHKLSCLSEPAALVADARFKSLTTSYSIAPTLEHSCAVDDERNLWCWGDGGSGQLGDGEPICSRVPRDLSAVFYEAFAAAG